MSNSTAIELAESLLQTVDRWGWEIGYRRWCATPLSTAPEAAALHQLALGWHAVERVQAAEADQHFQAVYEHPVVGGLAYVGKALVSVRAKDFETAEAALCRAEQTATAGTRLAGAIAHVRGTKAAHLGAHRMAQEYLFRAIETLGREHYAFGRALDTLGGLYANQDNFLIARLLFQQSLERKLLVDDYRGLALTHGQLGRLYLDWGYLARAEEHFQEDLRLSEDLGDTFGQARMHGALGQVGLFQVEELAVRGRDDLASQAAEQADHRLATCIELSQRWRFTVSEAFARKDRALLKIFSGQLEQAETDLAEACRLFALQGFSEGLAHGRRAAGVLDRARRAWGPAREHLQAALRYFAQRDDRAEAARSRLEIARLLRDAAEPMALVEQAFTEALVAAEDTRRTALIRLVEHELRTASPAAYWQEMFKRCRGRSVDGDATTLHDGTREVATVIYFDLQGATDFVCGRDPEEVMLTINQMMSDTAFVLRRHQAESVAFRGDGFLALVRGTDHATRAVEAGLDLVAAIDEFNAPRRVLGIPEFRCRIGIATGEALFGNVGTYEKMDYSGVGLMMNLGARLEAKGEAGKPCISQATYELAADRFLYAVGNPRMIDAKGIGPTPAWDVVGRR